MQFFDDLRSSASICGSVCLLDFGFSAKRGEGRGFQPLGSATVNFHFETFDFETGSDLGFDKRDGIALVGWRHGTHRKRYRGPDSGGYSRFQATAWNCAGRLEALLDKQDGGKP